MSVKSRHSRPRDTHFITDSGSHVKSSTMSKPTHFVKSTFLGIFDSESCTHMLVMRHYAVGSRKEIKNAVKSEVPSCSRPPRSIPLHKAAPLPHRQKLPCL